NYCFYTKTPSIVFISDDFREVPLNRMLHYFSAMRKNPCLVYLHSQGKKHDLNIPKIDAILKHPFLFKDVKKVLSHLFNK
ncbi:hypothetical protein ABTM28_20470, partial [Acinetobacter baumannii]